MHMTTSDSLSFVHHILHCNRIIRIKTEESLGEKEENKCTRTPANFQWEENRKKKYLHATSMVADWLFAFPRGDHAWQSHLNGDLPKYSYTKSFDIVAVTSRNETPVCGSTCESNVDGGGCELPLHLNVSCKTTRKTKENEWMEREKKINHMNGEIKEKFIDYIIVGCACACVCDFQSITTKKKQKTHTHSRIRNTIIHTELTAMRLL